MPWFKKPLKHEYYALALATVVLLLVLVSCFICLQLFKTKQPEKECDNAMVTNGGRSTRRAVRTRHASHATRVGSPERFWTPLSPMIYRPCFIDPYGSGRESCNGYTSGLMPSIDVEQEGGWLCPGLLGTVV
jgi:hypothetical protein